MKQDLARVLHFAFLVMPRGHWSRPLS